MPSKRALPCQGAKGRHGRNLRSREELVKENVQAIYKIDALQAKNDQLKELLDKLTDGEIAYVKNVQRLTAENDRLRGILNDLAFDEGLYQQNIDLANQQALEANHD